MYDVLIVGGGAAALSAALVLGRFRRRVLICDHQRPRNAVATAAHGFLTRDGMPPSELLRIGREQLEPYDTVEYRVTEIVQLKRLVGSDGFEAIDRSGAVYHARHVLLATGVRDELPPIPGLADYWGKAVHHCPYCHGWEVRDQSIIVIGDGETLSHLAPLLKVLSPAVSACLYGEPGLTAAQLERLRQQEVTVHDSRVAAVEGDGQSLHGVRLENGQLIPCQAIFVRPKQQPHSPFAGDLGCATDEHGFVTVDPLGRTSVPGVYAAGDITSRMQQLIMAAAAGATAAAGINSDMVFA